MVGGCSLLKIGGGFCIGWFTLSLFSLKKFYPKNFVVYAKRKNLSSVHQR
jgi:hypothetical protein